MTLDELRDAHAKRLGWEWQGGCKWFNSRKSGIDATIYTHPIPATLDAIAGLMPSGWWWRRFIDLDGSVCWVAGQDISRWVVCKVPDTGDELLDRARLAWLAWEAEAKGAGQ
jgi:hypothetical protein